MSEDEVTDEATADEAASDADYVDDYEDVSIFELSDERETTLLEKQTECTFMWSNSKGEPVGVIMNYVWRKRSFWLTATRRRKRIAAIEARPRVAIAVSSRGTSIGISQSLTYKGTAVLHDDDETKQWMYAELSNAVRPGEPEKAVAFAEHLDTPGRVVIEVIPDTRIGFDSDSMFKDSPAGKSQTHVD